MNEPRDSASAAPIVADQAPPHAESEPVFSWRWIKGIVKCLGPAGPLAVMASTLPPLGGFVLLGFMGSIAPWLRDMGWGGVAFYMIRFIILAAMSLLPTYACSILGGYTFGFWIGLPASILSFCGAGLLAYLINRGATGDRVLMIFREHPKWELIRRALIGSGFWRALWIITLIRIPPTSPFALGNFVFAATRAPIWPYLLGTAIGMTPRTGAVVWAAWHFHSLDLKQNGWVYAATAAVTIAVIAAVSAVANRAMRHMTREQSEVSGMGDGV